MPIRSQRILAAALRRRDPRRPAIEQSRATLLVLRPLPGPVPSNKPAVRLFVGCEAGQFRALRVFVWSILQVRDPARCYEIHLMHDLAGFRQGLWLTGFTNYRFAIPELAGGQGRAIYNDCDQIYLKDPALLFDADMGTHGVLSINDHDTSVMLIDCQRMLDRWNLNAAQTTRNRSLEAGMRAQASLWGSVDALWNARDDEYRAGHSAALHFTTIHTQPCRPFPQDYVYRDNPAARIWLELERAADHSGFQLFSAAHPSASYATAVADIAAPALSASTQDWRGDATQVVAACNASGLRAYTASTIRMDALAAAMPDIATTCLQLPQLKGEAPVETAVSVALGLERMPHLDVPWLLERLFAQAGRAVVVCVDNRDPSRSRSPANAQWWYAQLQAVARRYPQLGWRLLVREPGLLGLHHWRRYSGGALLNAAPQVWALLHYKSGHRSQALGLARALGWPFTPHDIRRQLLRHLPGMLLVCAGRSRVPGGLRAPWPDVVIASGWLPSVLAHGIAKASAGRTRLILLGRRAVPIGETPGFSIHCKHFDLPPHERQLETLLPPAKAIQAQLQAAAMRWPDLYKADPRPHVALLVGGSSKQQQLDARTARHMVQRVAAASHAAGGALTILTSRRTGRAVNAILQAAREAGVKVEVWSPRAGTDNPYLGYLASADILVVTGESESMLAEAVAAGKPVYIYPLPTRKPGLRQRLSDWAVRQANTDRYNARGSRRPQQGLQYLCARAMELRWLLPRRNLDELHQNLQQFGLTRMFADQLECWQPAVWDEMSAIVRRIRSELVPEPQRVNATPREAASA